MAESKPVRLALVGYRRFWDYKLFSKHVDLLIEEIGRPESIISGGCIGTDKLAERYAKEHEIDMVVLKEDRKRFPVGNMCYAMRDRQIARDCTHMLAFPSEEGKGTQLTIEFAKRLGRNVKIVNV